MAYNGESWQSNNFTQELLTRPRVGRRDRRDVRRSMVRLGGPIVRDKLWFMFAARQYAVDNKIPGVDVIDDQYIKLAALRLTWQINPSNKVSVHHDRMYKWRHHRNDPPPALADAEASRIHDNPLYYWGVVKWTSTIGQRLLVEVGQTHYFQPNTMRYQPGVGQDPFTPGWYAECLAGGSRPRHHQPVAGGREAAACPSATAGRARCLTSPAPTTSRPEATGTGAGNGPIRSRLPISSRNTGPAYPTPCSCAIRRSRSRTPR